jgi:hypothetical protein
MSSEKRLDTSLGQKFPSRVNFRLGFATVDPLKAADGNHLAAHSSASDGSKLDLHA